jgi:hypothetical protein
MRYGHRGRHRRRRALIIALAAVLAAAFAFWVGGSVVQSFSTNDFQWTLGQLH